jgi:putative aldouronate transport system permease protein
MNFFRELPKEIEDAAFIDGAGHWRTLWKICVPLSTPALATLTLFVLVNHWNAWFDGIIFMNRPEKYPLQSYLRTIIVNVQSGMLTQEERQRLLTVDERTSKAAQIFIATIPVLMVYPYLQKYFTTGLVLGSVKG